MARTLLAHEHRVDEVIDAVRADRVNGLVMMPARFTLDGHEETAGGEEWPNYQTDCYGVWLWAVADRIRRVGMLDDELRAAIRLTIRYLLAAGDEPCYDCWEEHPGNRHTSLLAAVAAGLRDAGALVDDPAATAMAAALVERITGLESLMLRLGDLIEHLLARSTVPEGRYDRVARQKELANVRAVVQICTSEPGIQTEMISTRKPLAPQGPMKLAKRRTGGIRIQTSRIASEAERCVDDRRHLRYLCHDDRPFNLRISTNDIAAHPAAPEPSICSDRRLCESRR